MRKLLVCMTAAALMLALGNAASFAGDEKKSEITVTGFITDSHCKGEGAKDGHKDCALKCAKEKVEEFAGATVTVKGTVDGENIKMSSIAKAEAPPAGK